jgi:hypothetical protein
MSKGNTQPMRSRREAAKQRLEAQLVRGTKPEKVNGRTSDVMVSLTDADKNRIGREIESINNPKKR